MTSTDEILDLEVERDMDIEGGNKQDKCEVILHLVRACPAVGHMACP